MSTDNHAMYWVKEPHCKQAFTDCWETDVLLRLINKTKFLEVLDCSDLQF
jgi:hypothetical protein